MISIRSLVKMSCVAGCLGAVNVATASAEPAPAQAQADNEPPAATASPYLVAPPSPLPPSQSSIFHVLGEAKDLLNNLVRVDVDQNGHSNVRVNAPFVKVNVKDGQSTVRVDAPFVHVQRGEVGKDGQSAVKVDAPFVHVQKQDGVPVSVKAPFVNLHSGNGMHSNPATLAPSTAEPPQPNSGSNQSASPPDTQQH